MSKGNELEVGGRAWSGGLAHYKETFFGTQLTIAVVTAAVLVRTHRLVAALAFFATMQIGAVAGAVWAAHLKERIRRGSLRKMRI